MDILREELMMNVFHPKKLEYYLNLGYDIFEDIYFEVRLIIVKNSF